MATTTATKTVSFKSPYTGRTFQHLTELLVGRDGYMAGGECSDNGGAVAVAAFTFVQRGIVAEADAVSVTFPAEIVDGGNVIEPAWLIASMTDDNATSGVTLTVTNSLEAAASAVVIAFKAGHAWQNPVPVDLTGPAMLAREVGIEDGAAGRVTVAATYVTDIDVERGQIVDPDGVRRRLSAGAASTAEAFNLTPTPPDGALERTDHIVRRQVDAVVAEVKHLQGPLRGGSSAVTLVTGSGIIRPHYYGKRGGTQLEQWWAWTVGGPPSNLRIMGGPGGIAFAAATLLVGAGTITETWIVGQRAGDDAVILLYIDAGNVLKMVSFDAAAGTVVDAAVTLNGDAGVKSYLHAAQVDGDAFHVVYRQQEGGNGEIYYGKFSFAAATFGTAVITPDYVDGAAEGSLSLWPDVATDRYGRAHVCWINGATGTDGSLKYKVFTPNGETELETQTFAPGDSVGTTDDSVIADPTAGAAGFVTELFDAFSVCHVTVTPHDEVYIALLGESTAASPLIDHALLYHPNFERDIGFPIVSVASTAGLLEATLTAVDWPLRSCDIVAGELGQLHLGLLSTDGVTNRYQLLTLNTQPFRNGFFEPRTLLLGENCSTIADNGGFNDLALERSLTGGVMLLTRAGSGGATDAVYQHRGGLRPSTTIVNTVAYGLQVDYHPKDLPLVQWEVGPDADLLAPPYLGGAAPLGEDGIFATSHPRPKKMNYPFLVGDRGDYQGYGSLRRALAEAQRLGGGDVVVRAGYHQIPTTVTTDYFTVGGGVSLRGEPNAILDFTTSIGLYASGSNRVIVGHAVAGNILTLAKAEALGSGIGYVPRVGDVVDLADVGGSGCHTIRAILTPVGTDVRYLLEDNENGAPTLGTSTYLFAAGVKIENLTLRAALTGATHFHLTAAGLYQPSIRNLRIEGSMTGGASGAAVYLNGCVAPVVENLDFRGLDCDAALYAFRLAGNSEHSRAGAAIIRGLRLVDGSGRIRIETSATEVVLQDCSGDGTDATKTLYSIAAGRATAVHMINCEGRATGDVAFLTTNVGKVVRSPEDFGAQAFEDDNTRAAASNAVIYLTGDAPNQVFNGTTDDVITTAVNERVLKAGDTLEGVFEIRSADYYAQLGRQQVIDRFGQFTRLGDHHLEDFYRDPFDAANGWTNDSVAGGTAVWTAPHKLVLASVVSAGKRGTAYHSRAIVGPWTNKPVWRARAKTTNTDDVGNSTIIGIVEPGSTPVVFFHQSPPTYAGSGAMRLIVTNGAATPTTVNTTFTPVDGTWYWFWIWYISATEAGWGISADADGDGATWIQSGTLAVGSGAMNADPATSYFSTENDGTGGAGELHVDVMELWTTSRQTT